MENWAAANSKGSRTVLLSGKVVLVTGGGRGLGGCISRVCAAHGASVAINYAHGESAAQNTAKQIQDSGGIAEVFAGDVRSQADVERVVAEVITRFGRIDGVVNNAISGKQHGPFLEATPEDFNTAFDFGCTAIVNTVKAVHPHMVAQGGGRIVNIVTEIWNMCPPNWTVYMAGKGAMVGLSRSLAGELGPDNITVNMVAPGWMADEKVDTTSEGSLNFAKTIPLRRHGSGDEIGNACVFFLSELASYVTGTYMPVTGGRVNQAGV
jgi:3-oxoacyl-[acyl-carrier protein] reductase